MNGSHGTRGVAIVGNGAAAAEAVITMRAAGYQGKIDLFADNPYPPYNPMLGTYLVSGAVSAAQCFPFGDAGFYGRNRINAHLESPVTELDPDSRELTTAHGSRHPFRRCLVASGAHTGFPPIPGIAPGARDPRIFGLRSFADAGRLKIGIAEAVERAQESGRRPRGMVLGASFAGIKVADVLQQAGMAVSIIEREAFVLPLSAHPECAALMQDHLREKGFRLRVGAAMCSVDGTPRGLAAHFAESDETEEADLLVVCTGSRPNLGFLDRGRVTVEIGLVVNEHMETSVPTLYAAGDVAQALNPLTGRYEVVGLWANARHQGRVAGLNMIGAHAEYSGGIPCNITHVGDMMFAGIGCMKEFDDVETRRAADGFSAWAFQGGRLVGVNILGRALSPGVIMSALARGAERCTTGPWCTAEDWLREITWMTVG